MHSNDSISNAGQGSGDTFNGPGADARSQIELARAGSGHYIEDFVLARESDARNRLLMLSMIQRSCGVRPNIPGCRDIHAAGLEPLLTPKAWNATAISDRQNRGVVFIHEGTLFFYWMGSAATTDEDSENLFTNELIKLVDRFRPRNLYIAAFTRLVRSAVVNGGLLGSLQGTRTTVIYPDGEIRPWTKEGESAWQMHAMFASMERSEIVLRNLIGTVINAERGGSPFGSIGLPIGYRMNVKRVVADPTMKELVERVLLTVADPGITDRQAAERIGSLGVINRVVKAGGWDLDSHVGRARDPRSVIQSILKWLPLYETGVWNLTRRNPIKGAEQIASVAVQRTNPGDDGFLIIPHRWGVPDGGWADPEVFALVDHRVQRDEQRRTLNGRKTQRPLAGLGSWESGAYEYLLTS